MAIDSREIEGLSCGTCQWNNSEYCPVSKLSRWSNNIDYCSYYEDRETREDLVEIILLRLGYED